MAKYEYNIGSSGILGPAIYNHSLYMPDISDIIIIIIIIIIVQKYKLSAYSRIKIKTYWCICKQCSTQY